MRIWVLDRVGDCDIYFAEATLQHDDLAGHARLAATSPIRICGAEAAATRWEIREWIERGRVAVVQPNIGRGGGLTEIRRIADMCELHGVQVVPHGWKTGITSAVGRHFQAACPAAPFFEYVSPAVFDSPLRRELVSPEPQIVDGEMALPDRARPRHRAQRGAGRSASAPSRRDTAAVQDTRYRAIVSGSRLTPRPGRLGTCDRPSPPIGKLSFVSSQRSGDWLVEYSQGSSVPVLRQEGEVGGDGDVGLVAVGDHALAEALGERGECA